MDAIPGLAYYGYATRILGNFQGGNSLLHVQVALLAALYTSQLAHPLQSHGWISHAARACQVLVRPYVLPLYSKLKLLTRLRKKFEKMNDDLVKDLCKFAYWTCLQLER